MNCERAQQLLLSGAEEPLTAAARTALQAHLAACPACRRERERVARLDEALVQWVAAAPLAPSTATRRRLVAPRTRGQALLRRVVAAGGRVARTAALRGAVLALLLLTLLGLGASLGLPQARTLVQAGLRPFGGGEATLPVLPIAGDRIWVEAVTPSSDTQLGHAPTFDIYLGYTLASAPEGLISVRLAADPEGETRYFAAPVRVDWGTNRVAVHLSVDNARAREILASRTVQIEVLMRAAVTSGEASLLARATYGTWTLPLDAAPIP